MKNLFWHLSCITWQIFKQMWDQIWSWPWPSQHVHSSVWFEKITLSWLICRNLNHLKTYQLWLCPLRMCHQGSIGEGVEPTTSFLTYIYHPILHLTRCETFNSFNLYIIQFFILFDAGLSTTGNFIRKMLWNSDLMWLNLSDMILYQMFGRRSRRIFSETSSTSRCE